MTSTSALSKTKPVPCPRIPPKIALDSVLASSFANASQGRVSNPPAASRTYAVTSHPLIVITVIRTKTARPAHTELPDLIRYPRWGAEVGTLDMHDPRHSPDTGPNSHNRLVAEWLNQLGIRGRGHALSPNSGP